MFSQSQKVVLATTILFGLSSAVVINPRATKDICGQKGYDQGNGNYYYSSSAKVNSYAACSAKCAADATCKSFGVGEACMLFNIPLSGNFDADSQSSDTYYDKACLSSSSTSTMKTTASSSSSQQKSSSKTTSSTVAAAISAKTTTTSSSTVVKAVSTSSSMTPKTATTTSKPTSSSATSVSPGSTGSATTAVTVPSGCSAPSSVELTSLSWFNSTHNLDCPTPNYPSGSEVCFDDTHVCVDATDGVAGGPTVCDCVPYCTVGLPSYAYQPIGYGPPDNITINLNDPSQPTCTAVNPTGFRDFEIGVGHVNCGSTQDILEFYGNSNQDTGNTGTVNYNGYIYGLNTACGGTPQYSGSFPLSCTRDAGGNATCGIGNEPVTLTLTSIYPN